MFSSREGNKLSRSPQENMVGRLRLCFWFIGLLWLIAVSASASERADHILIVKSARTMTLLNHGKVLKSYKVALGTMPVGAKRKHGDHRTPEGRYVIDGKNAHSQFHLALHLSYPNPTDQQQARKLGVNPGGDVEIHGLMPQYAWMGSLHTQHDWTDGCIAVTNSEIEEIWDLVSVGTSVEIKP